MTGTALLDTSVVIAITQEGREYDLRRYDRLFVSSITYAELRLGVASARTAEAAAER
ncbi:PIN domain-containing protein [uncultured Agrococcus sp.]|uniref:PIN domain-containing protein n=1 Tax=uncultured Agrococcus sp. TaxID=382258 RepID=UPI00344C1587